MTTRTGFQLPLRARNSIPASGFLVSLVLFLYFEEPLLLYSHTSCCLWLLLEPGPGRPSVPILLLALQFCSCSQWCHRFFAGAGLPATVTILFSKFLSYLLLLEFMLFRHWRFWIYLPCLLHLLYSSLYFFLRVLRKLFEWFSNLLIWFN